MIGFKRARWKRGWSLLIAAALLLGTAGCGPERGTPPEEKIRLTFRHVWVQQHNQQMLKIMTEVIKNFEKANPSIRVDFEGVHQTVHREQRLKSEMVTGNPPDLFVLFGGAEIEPYVRAERLLDLSGFLRENGLLNSFHDLSLWTFGAGVYGLPIEGFAEPVYYNKQLFAQLGLSVPTNWEQLVQVVTKLKAAGKVPFALGNQERWPGAMHYHYFLQRYAGSEVINQIVQGKGTFLHADYEKATERFLEFARLQPFPPQSDTRSIADSERMFLDGEAAMFLNGSWELQLFQSEEAKPDFVSSIGVFNFPQLTAAKPTSEGLASGYTFGLGLSSALEGERRKAALSLLKAIYSPEVQRRIVYESYRLPSMKISVDYERTGPVYRQIAELMQASAPSFVPYDNALPPALQETFFQVTEQLIAGRLTSRAALERMEEQLQQYYELVGK
jgi:raffinose/stachyose/melibiose transport system substrate-binding protein